MIVEIKINGHTYMTLSTHDTPFTKVFAIIYFFFFVVTTITINVAITLWFFHFSHEARRNTTKHVFSDIGYVHLNIAYLVDFDGLNFRSFVLDWCKFRDLEAQDTVLVVALDAFKVRVFG